MRVSVCYYKVMNELVEEVKKKIDTLTSLYVKLIFVSCVLVLNFTTILLLSTLTHQKKLQVTFFDVGQGDSILIETPSGKLMLVDGGVSAIVLDRLSKRLSYFHRTIDVVVATHPDADHVTGLIPVLEKYNVGIIVVSPVDGDTKIFEKLHESIRNEHADTHVGQTGDVIDFHDGVVAHILYPGKNYHEKKNDTNDASVSMLVEYGDERFLLTGDLPTQEESKLLGQIENSHIMIYKAGHHGSKYSSGEQLLSYIKPEYTIISAGKNNKYGHPNPETIERLTKYSKEIISTIDKGSITFETDGKQIEIMTDH